MRRGRLSTQFSSGPRVRRLTRLVILLAVMALAFGATAGPASAQTIDDAANELASTGQFSEFEINATTQTAIDRANDNGIAFAWVDNDGASAAQELADPLLEKMLEQTPQYRTLIVLGNDGFWITTDSDRGPELAAASQSQFEAGAVGAGIDIVTDLITGAGAAPTTNTTTGSATSGTAGSSGSTGSSGGSGLLGTIFVVGILGLLAFLAIRWMRGRSKEKKEAEIDLANDRAEIEEQLKDNADLVIDLGDRVIASGNQELIRTYEEASRGYQEVSTTLAEAKTADEVDRLDDIIDDAEWKFLTIEAKLDGRPAPARPVDDDDLPPATPPAPTGSPTTPAPPTRSDRPALGRDESVLGSGRSSSRTSSRSSSRSSGRSSGRSGGGLGGMLGGVLGSILMGQVNKPRSRRTQQRASSRSGSSGGFGNIGTGGLGGGSGPGSSGGGVLKRGGSSGGSRSGGGGGFSNRRSGGGGGFNR